MEATKFELTSLSHLHMNDLLTKREEVESTGWTKALGTPIKQQQTDIYQPFEVNKHCENLRDNFSAIWRQQNSAQGFILKLFWHLIIKCFWRAKLVHECFNKILLETKFYTRIPSVPKTLKIRIILSNISEWS